MIVFALETFKIVWHAAKKKKGEENVEQYCLYCTDQVTGTQPLFDFRWLNTFVVQQHNTRGMS